MLGCVAILGYGEEATLREPNAPAPTTEGGSDTGPTPIPETGTPDTSVPVDAGGKGMFVVVGDYGFKMSSPDGVTWTGGGIPDAGEDFYLTSVAFGQGKAVAVGWDVYTSTNGVDWTRHKRLPQWLGGIAFGQNKWVGAGGVGQRAASENGADWGFVQTNGGVEFDGVAFGDVGGGRFVAHRTNGTLAVSDNGVTWTDVAEAQAASIVFAQGAFFGVGSEGRPQKVVRRSTDGVTWTTVYTAVADLSWMTYGHMGFVAVTRFGDSVVTSPDGVTWTERVAPGANGAIAAGAGRYVCCSGTSPTVCRHSPNGVSWTESKSVPNGGVRGIGFGVVQ